MEVMQREEAQAQNAEEAALAVIDQAVREYAPVAVYALFSGGHDSLTSTVIAARHPAFTAVVHINTGIGIAETHDFVQQTCRDQGWELIELRPDVEYEQLVLTRGGFPSGPKSHNSMYWFLKQKPLDGLIRDSKRKPGDNVMLVTGIRVQESARRMAAGISVPIRRDDHARLWVNPILDWSALDCGRYIDAIGLRRNPVVDLLHRSGECLCGALAREDEIHEIDHWFPAAGERIHRLEAVARTHGLKHTRWASQKKWGDAEQITLPMCASCQVVTNVT